MDLSERGAFGMDDKQPGYYLTMQFSVLRGGSRWTTEAGPFASADEAIDATIGDRDYGSDYRRCILTRVDEAGTSVAIMHPRLEYKRQHDDWEMWNEGQSREAEARQGVADELRAVVRGLHPYTADG